MRVCKCNSMAINEDPEQKECDVCYWKNKYLQVVEIHRNMLIESLKIVNKYVKSNDNKIEPITKLLKINKEI